MSTDEPRAVAVVVDRRRCIGTGVCEAIAPELFQVDDDGYSNFLGDPARADGALVDEVIASCPNAAIRRVAAQ